MTLFKQVGVYSEVNFCMRVSPIVVFLSLFILGKSAFDLGGRLFIVLHKKNEIWAMNRGVFIKGGGVLGMN